MLSLNGSQFDKTSKLVHCNDDNLVKCHLPEGITSDKTLIC